MYNNNLKMEFIDSEIKSGSRRNVAITCFEATQSYEEKYGKDICTFEENEINEVLSGIVGARSSGAATRTSVLKLYANWCMRRGYPGATDVILTTKPDTTCRFKEQSVSNPSHLQRVLNAVFGSDEDTSVDCVYKGFFWMAFMGIPEEYSVQITTEDVDLGAHTISFNCNGERTEYRIYDEAYPVIKKLVSLDSFTIIHPLYPDRIRYKGRFCSHQLLRGVNSNKTIRDLRRISFDKMNACSSEVVKKSKLTYNRVLISGVFYRMYEWEKSHPNEHVDFSDYLKNVPENSGISSKLLDHKERFMRADYEKWKTVYH